MSRNEVKKNVPLLIRSQNAYSTGSHWKFIMKQPSSPFVESVRLDGALIPPLCNITANNNTLVFNEGAANITITIPTGAYSDIDLLSKISTLMNAASLALFTYSAVYSSIHFNTTITGTGTFILIETDASRPLLTMLGYTAAQVAAMALTIYHTSDNSTNLLYYMSLFVDIREFPGHGVTTHDHVLTHSFILPLIAANGSYTVLNRQTLGENTYYLGIATAVQHLHVTISDINGNNIDFKGQQWELLLMLNPGN